MSMPIKPGTDPRIEHKSAFLNGHTYHYLYAVPPSGKYTHTVFLVRMRVCILAVVMLMLSRFMAGLICRLDGDTKFLRSWSWDSGSWRLI
jgi:hypothetical protein